MIIAALFSRHPVLILIASSAVLGADSRHQAQFQSVVEPFLRQSCAGCHSSQLKTAGLDLSQFRTAAAAVAERDAWERALKKMRSGEMPPPAGPRPSPESLRAASEWMERQVARYDASHPVDPGTVTARRLNRAEYNRTVRDLLGVDFRPADDFPLDDSGYGFDNIGDVLTLSPVLMEKYWKAADEIVRAAFDAPVTGKPTLRRIKVREAGRPEVLPEDPDGAPLVARNALLYLLRVPAEGTYDINIIVSGMGHPDVKPPKLAILVDGKQVRVVGVETDEEGVYKQREFNVRRRLTPGVHQVGAAFLKDSEYATLERKGPGHEPRNVLTVGTIELRGPFDPAEAPRPESYARLVTCRPETPDSWTPCARRILTPFTRNAWRRPVQPAEIDRLIGFVTLARKRGDTFENGLKTAVKAVLVSPHFLFRIERDATARADGIRFLNDHELASRLSYFLWSSMPDETLFRLAEARKLSGLETLRAQVRRMILDPKADGLIENFAGQWLELRKLSSVSPDPMAFPDFDTELSQAMGKETTLFFKSVLHGNGPITDFIDGRYTFVNERLAGHYGLAGVQGPGFRRVELDGTQRSGVLTQASVLAVTSYPNRTSPVLRGLWVLENLLGTPPPPPPPNVPSLDEAKAAGDLPLRQRLEKHRADAACAACHNRMDAIGFGLENYDAVGKWRTQDGGSPVDTTGELPGKRQFSGPAELKAILLAEKDDFTECLTEKLLTYALGRGVGREDRPVIASVARKVASQNYGFATLVEEIALSVPFRQRRIPRHTPTDTPVARNGDKR